MSEPLQKTSPGAGPAPTGEPDGEFQHHLDPKRWWALAVIAVSQLMVVLDATIVNIALPHASAALHIAPNDRQWLITAYALPFGSLLLLGGRIADWVGRKRMLIVALCGFAIASAVGGAAQEPWMLFAARALQGVFGAIMAPAALALITVTFIEARERARAFAVFGAIAGGGSAIGLLLGGILTSYVDWRWCLFVNIPIAAVALLAALPILRESKAPTGDNYDVAGALLATAGLASVVWGFTRAPLHTWGSVQTWGWLVGGVLLLALFVLVESRSSSPLMPLRIIRNRNRAGAYIVGLFVGTGLFGMFLFLTYFVQGTLQFSPIKAGVAFLPFSLGVVIGAGVGSQLVLRVGARVMIPVGLVLGTLGLAWLGTIEAGSTYWGKVFPAELVISVGMGFIFMSTTNVALVGVSPADAGVASAMVNTTQQIGGSLGTALLSTVAANATTSYFFGHLPTGVTAAQAGAAVPQLGALAEGVQPSDPSVLQLLPTWGAANVHGYGMAFWWGSALFVVAAVASLLLINAGRADLPQGEHSAAMV
ncbi:MFS transporter [Nakamurella endophytica]|uniref:MFS transporter n=1 Tax=Nakamurella endophytica TaxID=1748367 RepID=A0A917SQ09_9ACTN|nr:MFS transporter [Nakamurella endophytica]GGL91038.1 MFS transporter [Nakamurella endophytica]